MEISRQWRYRYLSTAHRQCVTGGFTEKKKAFPKLGSRWPIPIWIQKTPEGFEKFFPWRNLKTGTRNFWMITINGFPVRFPGKKNGMHPWKICSFRFLTEKGRERSSVVYIIRFPVRKRCLSRHLPEWEKPCLQFFHLYVPSERGRAKHFFTLPQKPLQEQLPGKRSILCVKMDWNLRSQPLPQKKSFVSWIHRNVHRRNAPMRKDILTGWTMQSMNFGQPKRYIPEKWSVPMQKNGRYVLLRCAWIFPSG
jgi:DEAD_2.